MALADFQALVDGMVRDTSGEILEADRDAAIELAVLRYSLDRPDLAVEDVTAAAGRFQDLPAGWQSGFSSVRDIEVPPEADPPSYLAAGAWAIEAVPSGVRLRLADGLAADDTLRIRYTVRHRVDAGTDTVPETARGPICALAAAHLLDALAAARSGDGSSTITSDSVDHATRVQEYAARARALRKRYEDELGVQANRLVGASAVGNLTLRDSRGRPRLTHG